MKPEKDDTKLRKYEEKLNLQEDYKILGEELKSTYIYSHELKKLGLPKTIEEFLTLNRFNKFKGSNDKDELIKKRHEEEEKRYRERSDRGLFSSRSFAIGLVGVASCYLIIMICKAYRKMSEEQEAAYELGESLTYYYDTESYDWNQYESQDDQYPTHGVHRDFDYNVTIGSSSLFDENESADIHGVLLNFNAGCTVTSQDGFNNN